MSLRRVILEMGAGTDLHGRDYTKAAVRGARDALQHASLTFLRTLDIDPESMRVDVTVGALARVCGLCVLLAQGRVLRRRRLLVAVLG